MVTNSKILVAGGSGFIGANLISELIYRGNKVVSISKNSRQINKKVNNLEYIFYDLRKPICKNQFKSFYDIDYVINCSGYIDHSNFLSGGKEIFKDHFESLYSLIKLSIELKVKTFVHLGSSDEYGINKSPIKESVRESPISPYALSKLTGTHYLQQCFREDILNTVILRPFLVFGEMQSKDRFLPYLIDNCINNRDFKVSKGEQIRDYLYIKDFNNAIIKSLSNDKAYGEIMNIASGIPISIKDVIYMVREIVGQGNPLFGGIDYREGESMELYANISKAKKILNWVPNHNFKESLEKVVAWYLENG